MKNARYDGAKRVKHALYVVKTVEYILFVFTIDNTETKSTAAAKYGQRPGRSGSAQHTEDPHATRYQTIFHARKD